MTAALGDWMDKKLADAGNRIEAAILATTPKMKSQAAGKMGYGTREVGDLVVAAINAA